MKKIISLFLILILTVSLLFTPAFAANEKIYVFNDTKVDLIQRTPPITQGNDLYMPLSFFIDNSNITFKYDGLTQVLSLFKDNYELHFNMNTNVCTNEYKISYNAKVSFINSTFYIPLYFVCLRFNMNYSNINNGKILRISDYNAKLTNNQIISLYSSSPEPAKDKKIYFIFNNNNIAYLDDILSSLASSNQKGNFFFTKETMENYPDKIIKLLYNEMPVGLSLDNMGNNYIEEYVDSANEIFEKITKQRFDMVFSSKEITNKKSLAFLDNNGYYLCRYNIDVLDKNNSSVNYLASRISQKINSSGNNIFLYFSGSSKTASIVKALKPTLEENAKKTYFISKTTPKLK